MWFLKIIFCFQLEQENGFDTFKAELNELGPLKNSTLKRDYSLDVSYDENEVIEVSICNLEKVKVIEKKANKARFQNFFIIFFIFHFKIIAESKSVVCHFSKKLCFFRRIIDLITLQKNTHQGVKLLQKREAVLYKNIQMDFLFYTHIQLTFLPRQQCCGSASL